MSWLQRIGRAFALLVPDSVCIGWDWQMEQKRNNRLRASFKQCGQGVMIGTDVVVRSPGNVRVGPGCHLNDFVHILGAGGVKFGTGVFVANHASIVSITHPVDTESLADAEAIYKPVVIEDHVWIGAHAVILPGLRLGRSCVIAAGAVVAHDVEPYSVVGGVPARLIRRKELRTAPAILKPGYTQSDAK